MEFNPRLIIKKILYLLVLVLISLLCGTLIFVIVLDTKLIYKSLFIVFSLLISLSISLIVKKLYDKLDKQFHGLTLIYDISTSLNFTLDHDILYKVNLYSIIEGLKFDSGAIIKLDSRKENLTIAYSFGFPKKYEKQLKDVVFENNIKNNIIAYTISQNNIVYNQTINKKFIINVEDIFGFKNYIIVPLINFKNRIGALLLNSDKTKISIEVNENIIKTIANYIASSLYNIMLYDELKKQLYENKKLNELAQKFNSELDLDKLMKLTIEASVELIGGERGNIFLYDSSVDSLVIKASASYTPLNPNIKFKSGEGIVGKVFLTGEPYLVNDTSKDKNFKYRPDSPRSIHSLLDVPIRTQEKIIGVLNIDNKDGGFDKNDMELLSTLSSHIGIAIENATLHKEIRKYSANLERLVRRKTWQLNKAKNDFERQNNLLTDRNQIIETDLLMARAVQQKIIPNELPQYNKIQVSAKYIPMDKVGGDFYDFFEIEPNKKLGFVISDVSGHGTAAAFITAMMKMAANNLPKNYLSAPGLFMETINKRIFGYTSSNFITAFYAVFDIDNEKLLISNAGHNNPILFKRKKNQFHHLYAKGRVLGFLDDVVFDQKELTLEKGDRIFFYTDGLSESMNDNYEEYSEKRIIEMLKKTSDYDVNKVVDLIYVDMLNWIKNPKNIVDDVAIVVFDYIG